MQHQFNSGYLEVFSIIEMLIPFVACGPTANHHIGFSSMVLRFKFTACIWRLNIARQNKTVTSG